MKKTIHTPHDRFFRAALSDHRVAKEFFEAHLPATIQEMVNLDKLILRKDSYVDENLQLSATDMLFDTEFSGEAGYVYLLVEHQSTPDVLMPFRLLKYMLAIMDQHLKTTEKTELPLIYPLIFYTGKNNYTHSTDIFDLFGASQDLARHIFLNPFELIVLNKIPDEALRQRVWAGILELSMKHIFERDILPHLRDMLSLLQQAEQSNGSDYVRTALTYLVTTGDVVDSELFLETVETGLSPKVREDIMTIAQQFEAKGFEKGIEKGVERGEIHAKKVIAQKLLRDGMSLEAVNQITDLPIEDLRLLVADKKH